MLFLRRTQVLKIKRSSGIVKEKTDKLDAALIARYALLYREELEPSRVKSISHLELGRLLALRDQLVRNNAGLKGTLKEMKILLSIPTTDSGCISLKRSIDYLAKQVKSVEDKTTFCSALKTKKTPIFQSLFLNILGM